MNDNFDTHVASVLEDAERAIKEAERVLAESRELQARLDGEMNLEKLLTPAMRAEVERQAQALFQADMAAIELEVRQRMAVVHKPQAPARRPAAYKMV